MINKIFNSILLSGLKACGSLVSYGHIFLIANKYDKNIAGIYFAAYNSVIFIAIIFTFGINTFLAKKISSDGGVSEIKNLNLLVAFPLIIVIILYVTANFLNIKLEIEFQNAAVNLYDIIYCVILATGASIGLGAVQGLNKINSYIFAQSLLPIIPIVAFLLVKKDNYGDFHDLMNLLSMGYATSFIYIMYKLRKLMTGYPDIKEIISKKIELINFWLIQLTQSIMFVVAPLIAAKSLTATEYSDYVVYSRLSALVGFVAISTNIALAPRISKLYSENKINELWKEVLEQNRINWISGFVVCVFIIYFAAEILLLIQNDVPENLMPLYIMLLSQCVVVTLGPIAPLMSMLKLESVFMWVNLIIAPVALVLFYWCADIFGLQGLAIAASCVMLIQNLICRYSLLKKFNFNKII